MGRLAEFNRGLSGDLIVSLDAMTVSCLASESSPWLGARPERECFVSQWRGRFGADKLARRGKREAEHEQKQDATDGRTGAERGEEVE